MAMSENSIQVLNFLKANTDPTMTAAKVAEALDLNPKSVNGIFTALQKKGLGVRIPGEIENVDGTHSAVKFLQLTDEGRDYDPTAEVAE